MATRPARPLPVPPVVPQDSRRMIGVLSLVMRTLNFPFPPETAQRLATMTCRLEPRIVTTSVSLPNVITSHRLVLSLREALVALAG
ncbi:hypothetical protein O3P69_007616 [Scylla paramamosain]|uniref:Uncharacterized protein n=1 Tax=Scylla paramamosain TaxID=85552 RepID=A0AAW0V0R9_SCYPA